MEINNVTNFRHPQSHRFLGLVSLSNPTASRGDAFFSGDELHESEVFWTGSDSVDSTLRSNSPLSCRNLGFRRPVRSGILAAISDDGYGAAVLPSSSPQFRAIPKPPQQQRHGGELTQSRRFQNSVPINVPLAMVNPRRSRQVEGFSVGDEEEDEEEMLPPHEIVAMKLKTTSSVLEGVGRTLKGRDLRQVRNAVWRQTGFLD